VLAESLRAGVKEVSAPQLFATPSDAAARVATLADIRPGHSVLEPCAGTGGLLDAIGTRPGIVAVEVNYYLAERLRTRYPFAAVHCDDFLALNGELAQFDRIVMNPPLERGADIGHLRGRAALDRRAEEPHGGPG
jgi:16S rRNA A1518/A1519 N6-dimethyltransferase RsmA/KsgA/DIM1 with predicted DNA glycosylase/AP lyase activity